jgi:hypothetical protein
MCIYVQAPLDEAAPYLIHATPVGSQADPLTTKPFRTGGSATFYDYPALYSSTNDIDAKNGMYAFRGVHPSDQVVGFDGNLTDLPGPMANRGKIFKDQILSVGLSNSGFSKSLEAWYGTDDPATNAATGAGRNGHLYNWRTKGVFGHGNGRNYGFGTCHWIKSCDPTTQWVGSACSATLTGVDYNGFCFVSDAGSLECGHLTAIDNAYGEKPVSFYATATAATTSSPTSRPGMTSRFTTMPSQGGVGVMTNRNVALTVVPATPGKSGKAYRCPTGSPAKGHGHYVSKRLLIAGCMIPTDKSYSSLAEVHIPAYCTNPADYKKGCMSPGALNFCSTCVQMDQCNFGSRGCTNPNSVNYNPGHTTEHPDYACIPKIEGCPIRNHYDVVSDLAAGYPVTKSVSSKPGYKSGYFAADNFRPGDLTGEWGANWRGGKVPQVVYAGTDGGALAVTNPGPTGANFGVGANSGCIVAIEGCTDASAVNYDKNANINSHTWCIPKKEGCMMPTDENAASTFVNPSGADGLNGAFNILTTVHNKQACVTARYGCSLNTPQAVPGTVGTLTPIYYDPTTTVNSACYYDIAGCLNKYAVNYGCQSYSSTSRCYGSAESWPTRHQPLICKYASDSLTSPPAPPSPSIPQGFENNPSVLIEYVVVVEIIISATLESFTQDKQDLAVANFKASLETANGGALPPGTRIEIRVVQASIKLIFEIISADQGTTDALENTVKTEMSSMAAISSAIGASSLGVTVLAPPNIKKEVKITILPNTCGAGCIVGIVIGVLAGLLLLGGGVHIYRKRQKAKKATYPA